MALRILDEQRAERVGAACEAIVPGSAHVGPVVYIDALLAGMPPHQREATLQAIDAIAAAIASGVLAQQERTPQFALMRALAIEAYYSDFVAPGFAGPGAWAEIDFQPPRSVDLDRDWSYLGIQ
ncbi:MAG: hypothetical protein ABSD08_09605 [Xanthobacteraceae bacterium]|jgi:hypothetical protein